eukprot:1783840-Rhodomonas_salina.1
MALYNCIQILQKWMKIGTRRDADLKMSRNSVLSSDGDLIISQSPYSDTVFSLPSHSCSCSKAFQIKRAVLTNVQAYKNNLLALSRVSFCSRVSECGRRRLSRTTTYSCLRIAPVLNRLT